MADLRSTLAKPKTDLLLWEAVSGLYALVPAHIASDVEQAANDLEKFAVAAYPVLTAMLKIADTNYGSLEAAKLSEETMKLSARWVENLINFSRREPKYFTKRNDAILCGYHHLHDPPSQAMSLNNWSQLWGTTSHRLNYTREEGRVTGWYPDRFQIFCQYFGSPFTKRRTTKRNGGGKEIMFSTLSLDYRR